MASATRAAIRQAKALEDVMVQLAEMRAQLARVEAKLDFIVALVPEDLGEDPVEASAELKKKK